MTLTLAPDGGAQWCLYNFDRKGCLSEAIRFVAAMFRRFWIACSAQGEIEHRSIYGEASPEEAKSLAEEGIEFHPLPVLPDERN